MKKFYPGFSTLICLSFLFTLDSCTADSPYVADETLVTVKIPTHQPSVFLMRYLRLIMHLIVLSLIRLRMQIRLLTRTGKSL
jgi:hypothetical protein